MGVHGLWELLAPVGRRVSVETLAGKKLAIDASIWMVQFMKAMRDEKGEMVRYAHLLGFFRRICKLLFLRTRPVFVFDGATPALKRRTLAARRRHRDAARAKIRKTAEKLLLNHLKAKRLEELAAEIKITKHKGKDDSKGKQIVGDDKGKQKQVLDPGSEIAMEESSGHDSVRARGSSNQESLDELLAASLAAEEEKNYTLGAGSAPGEEEEDDDENEEMLFPVGSGNLDPSVLASLPPSMQLDLLVQMRERVIAENRQKYQKIKKAPAKFSELQIKSYLKTVAFRREIDEVQKGAAGRGLDGVQTSRIASEANREFIFSSSFTGDKQMLAHRGVAKGQGIPATVDSLTTNISTSQPKSGEGISAGEVMKDFGPDVETYFDEKGRLRVSRVRGLGIRMTRDLQRNLDFIKEYEQENTLGDQYTDLVASCSMEVSDIVASLSENGLENASRLDQENNGMKKGSSTSERSESPIDISGVGRKDSLEISFSEDECRIVDTDADVFLQLVSGTPSAIALQESVHSYKTTNDSESDSIWEEGQINNVAGSSRLLAEEICGSKKSECNEDHPTLANKCDDDEVEWEEGVCHDSDGASDWQDEPGKADLRGLLEEDQAALANKGDDHEVVWEKGVCHDCTGASNQLDEPEKAVSRGSLDEEADLQEAIRRSLEDFNEQKCSISVQQNIKVGMSSQDETSASFALQDFAKNAGSAIALLENHLQRSPPRSLRELENSSGKDALQNPGSPKNHLDTCISDVNLSITEELKREKTSMKLQASNIRPVEPVNDQLDGVNQSLAATREVKRKSCFSMSIHDICGVTDINTSNNVSDILAYASKNDSQAGPSISPGEGYDGTFSENSSFIEETVVNIGKEAQQTDGKANESLKNFREKSASKDMEASETADDIGKDELQTVGEVNESVNIFREKGTTKVMKVSETPDDNSKEELQTVGKANESPNIFRDTNATQDVELSEANLDKEISLLKEERTELGNEQRRLERNAESVNSEMFAECQELLQMFGLPYIIAPMEAEAQCAFMEMANLVDGVVTDDSDVFLFGARSVYKNIFDDRKYVETYFMKDIENELGLDREKLVHMALLLGSDYTEGVSGIGIVNAIEVLHAFPEEDGLTKFREWIESPDPAILGKIDSNISGNSKKRSMKTNNDDVDGLRPIVEGDTSADTVVRGLNSENPSGSADTRYAFTSKHRNVSKNWHIPSSFPSQSVISAYTSPQVDESIEPFSWGKPDLFLLRKLCWDRFGWTNQKANELLLPVLKEHSKHETQLRLEAFYTFNERFAKIRSQRIKKALKGITGTLPSDLTDDPIEGSSSRESKKQSPSVSEICETKSSSGKGKRGKKDLDQSRKQKTRSKHMHSEDVSLVDSSRGDKTEKRGRGSGKGKGRGQGRGRASGQVKPSSESSDKSSADDSDGVGLEENQTQVPEEMPKLRRSLRHQKQVHYAEQDLGIDDSNNTNQMDHEELQDVVPENESVAKESKDNVDSANFDNLYGDSSSREYLFAGGGFCADANDLQGDATELAASKMQNSASVFGKDSFGDADGLEGSSGDYLFNGGGFCMDGDTQVNVIQPSSRPIEDSEPRKLSPDASQDAQYLTSVDTRQDDIVRILEEESPLPDEKPSGPQDVVKRGLSALPSLRRKRRKL